MKVTIVTQKEALFAEKRSNSMRNLTKQSVLSSKMPGLSRKLPNKH